MPVLRDQTRPFDGLNEISPEENDFSPFQQPRLSLPPYLIFLPLSQVHRLFLLHRGGTEYHPNFATTSKPFTVAPPKSQIPPQSIVQL